MPINWLKIGQKLLFLTFLSAGVAYAQGGRVDGVAFARSGAPAPGATIAICTQPAVTTTTPCSPLATLYTDRTLATPCSGTLLPPNVPGSPCSNPMVADGLGNYHFYFQAGTYYTIQFYGAGITPNIAPDQALPGGLFSPNSQNITFNGNLIFNGTTTFNSGIITNTLRVTGLTPLQCVQTDASSNLITLPCPSAGGSVTSVGLALPMQFNVTGSPVTTAGVLNAAWNDVQPNTFFRGPMPQGVGGTFDGFLNNIGSSTTPTAGPLTPSTAHDMAWFLPQTTGAQASPVTMPGPWVNQQTNGNIGAVFSNVLSSTTPVTAQATIASSNTWAGLLFFLKYTVATTPAVIQKKNSSGAIADGNSVTFTSNTVIGNAILVTMIGIPPSSVFATGTFTDSQGNNYTPLGQSQNAAGEVVFAAIATNITGVTTDQITFHTGTGPITSAAFTAFELSNIQAADRTPFFGPIVSSDLISPLSTFTGLSAGLLQMRTGVTTTTTCPTAAAAGSTCTYTLTWSPTWADAAYVAVCSGTGTITGFPVIQGVTNTATVTTITVENGTANEAQVSGYTDMRCIGLHP